MRDAQGRSVGTVTHSISNHPGVMETAISRVDCLSADDLRFQVTIANLPRLSGLLTRVLRRYGKPRPGGLPLYLTEFGYQTNPPDRLGVSWNKQAAYLNESEFRSYINPNVRTLGQFLLDDDGGDISLTFQSGLMQLGGELEEASRVAGATWWSTYRRIVLPLMAPTLMAVGMITFVGAARNIGNIALLTTSATRPLSILQLDYIAQRKFEEAVVVACIIMVISLAGALVAPRSPPAAAARTGR